MKVQMLLFTRHITLRNTLWFVDICCVTNQVQFIDKTVLAFCCIAHCAKQTATYAKSFPFNHEMINALALITWTLSPTAYKFQENLLRTMIQIENTYFELAKSCRRNCLVRFWILFDYFGAVFDLTRTFFRSFAIVEWWTHRLTSILINGSAWRPAMNGMRLRCETTVTIRLCTWSRQPTARKNFIRLKWVDLNASRKLSSYFRDFPLSGTFMSLWRRWPCPWLGLQGRSRLDRTSLFWRHRQLDRLWGEGESYDRVRLPKAQHRHRRSFVANIKKAQVPRVWSIARRSLPVFPRLQRCPSLLTIKWTTGSNTLAKARPEWTLEVSHWRSQQDSWRRRSCWIVLHFSYIHTTRRPHVYGQSIEVKTQLTQRDYLNMLAQKDDAHFTIFKKRRCFLVNNQYFQLDIYQEPSHPRCRGLMLLETYTSLEGEQLKKSLPKFLEIQKETTGDPYYSMFNLSLKEDWNNTKKFCYSLHGELHVHDEDDDCQPGSSNNRM